MKGRGAMSKYQFDIPNTIKKNTQEKIIVSLHNFILYKNITIWRYVYICLYFDISTYIRSNNVYG